MSRLGWNLVKSEAGMYINEMKKIIPRYEYSVQSKAEVTDKLVCKFFIKILTNSKDLLFNIIHLAHELQKDRVRDAFQKLVDDVDIFIDELKVRTLKWDPQIPAEWIKKLVEYDFYLTKGLQKFNQTLNSSYNKILNSKKPKIRGRYMEIYGEEYWEKIIGDTKELKDELDEIVNMFKERDITCNIRQITFEEIFKMVRDKIRKTI